MTTNQDLNIPKSDPDFPTDFLWGAATASHQVEGNNHNDWSEWEQVNAERLAKESEESFLWNPHWQKFKAEATNPKNYISGTACDHWNRYEEDFQTMEDLGFTVYRFSLEWSRIEPQKGKFNEEALHHYLLMIQSLKAKGIEPFVTLWHWTLPTWLRDEGGLLNTNFSSYFLRYAENALSVLGNDIKFVVTLNEPDVVVSHAYIKGAWPPQEKNILHALMATFHLQSAHKKVYSFIKERFPNIQVGIAKHNVYFEKANNTLWNTLLKKIADGTWNFWWLNRIKNYQDFIGLNHYNRNRIDGWYNKNPNTTQTDFGWDYTPESLEFAIRDLDRYHKPVYITENGLADAGDTLRQNFLPKAVGAIQRAIVTGSDVRGYMYWSLLDNFEWDKGYWLQFGLIEVDRGTQKRAIRPSAYWYRNFIKENSTK